MKSTMPKNTVELDGRTGEGGGQLVRIAVALSALTGTPIRIHHIRGNRGGKKGGGLKAQHASCVRWLGEATNAEVTGCAVGSFKLEFIPRAPPTALRGRNIRIDADSAASILLVFQAIFPFLLFASDSCSSEDPISLTIMGGTNVAYSLSFDYVDQVLLPVLESLGVPEVKRKLEYRGWSHGTRQIGSVKFEFTPMAPGHSLKASSWPKSTEPGPIDHIDITMIVPRDMHSAMKAALKLKLGLVFEGVRSNTLVDEDSHHPARVYVLLVAHTAIGYRFGRDWLYDRTTKGKSMDALATEVAQRVVDELYMEIRRGGCVDEYLQDQLVIFQALAKGRSSTTDSAEHADSGSEELFDRSDEPFGNGSLHTRSARWVVSQLLPDVNWIDNGNACEGIGWATQPTSSAQITTQAVTCDFPMKID